MNFDFLIYGFGGHGRVVIELAQQLGFQNIGVFDDADNGSVQLKGVHFLGAYNKTIAPHAPIVIAIGNNAIRKKLANQITHPYATLTHPSAVIAPSVNIQEGSVVLANAVIQAYTTIGAHCIINASAVVDHDVVLGNYVHIRPLAFIGSNSIVSPETTINPLQLIERHTQI